MTHICVSKLNRIGLNNGLSPSQRQAIIWTNTGILSICTLGTNFIEILSEIHTFSVTKMHLKMSSVKWRQCCPRLHVLRHVSWVNSQFLSEYHFHGLVQKYYMSSTLQGIDIWHFSKKPSNCQANRAKLPFNTLRLRQNGHHFLDDIFKCIFLNENDWILIKISLKFVLKGPINNIPALVQIMAWCRPGNKPLSEPMMVSLPMHKYVTRPQWVKPPRHWNEKRTESPKISRMI